jgi:hypothetical protein
MPGITDTETSSGTDITNSSSKGIPLNKYGSSLKCIGGDYLSLLS